MTASRSLFGCRGKTLDTATIVTALGLIVACSAAPDQAEESVSSQAVGGCEDGVEEYIDTITGEMVICVHTTTPGGSGGGPPPPVDPCWHFPWLCQSGPPEPPPNPCDIDPTLCGGGEEPGPSPIDPEFTAPPCETDANCPTNQTCDPNCKTCVPGGMLAAVNQVRAQGRSCIIKTASGGTTVKTFPPTNAVSYDCKLLGAAHQHAKNMATTGNYGHVVDKRDPQDRAALAGFTGTVSENIAAGPASPEAVLTAWLDSDKGHCGHIMNPDVSVTAAAWSKSDDKYGNYWVQMFGAW